MELSGAGNITTSAASQIVMANRLGKREEFTIVNYGAQIAWINFSNEQTAAVGVGIPLYAGATISGERKGDHSSCYQGSITAIQGAGGATTLAYWERVRP